MLIVCPNCATSYQVDKSSLGATGRSVRCVRCRKVWFVSNTEAMASIAASHQQDMVAFAADNAAEAFPEPEAAPAEALAEALDHDDRGPAPLPEAQDYQLPPQPVAAEDAPPLVPGESEATAPATPENTPEDIESVAARRIRRPPKRQKSRWPMPGWGTAIGLLVAINVGLIGWRTDVVRLLPQTASIYAAIGLEVNLRGLVFGDLVTRNETADGVTMLLVEGVIKNTLQRTVDVPRIRFAIRDAKGHEIYSWTALPARNQLAPGTTMQFRTRLASPPAESQAVLVRFFNRRDLIAGAQ
jgi:predicted Zn finger-like uncharacterized protein